MMILSKWLCMMRERSNKKKKYKIKFNLLEKNEAENIYSITYHVFKKNFTIYKIQTKKSTLLQIAFAFSFNLNWIRDFMKDISELFIRFCAVTHETALYSVLLYFIWIRISISLWNQLIFYLSIRWNWLISYLNIRENWLISLLNNRFY